MEQWKQIKGYENLYEISNLGNVKSLARLAKDKNGNLTRTLNKRLLKSTVNSSGYLMVNLYKDNKMKTYPLHILVAIHFNGHIPNGHINIIDHINNDKMDCRATNLQITTTRHNASKDIDKTKTSTKYIGVDICRTRYRAQALIQGKLVYLGLFDSPEEASDIYQTALKHEMHFNGDRKEFRAYLKIIK